MTADAQLVAGTSALVSTGKSLVTSAFLQVMPLILPLVLGLAVLWLVWKSLVRAINNARFDREMANGLSEVRNWQIQSDTNWASGMSTTEKYATAFGNQQVNQADLGGYLTHYATESSLPLDDRTKNAISNYSHDFSENRYIGTTEWVETLENFKEEARMPIEDKGGFTESDKEAIDLFGPDEAKRIKKVKASYPALIKKLEKREASWKT